MNIMHNLDYNPLCFKFIISQESCKTIQVIIFNWSCNYHQRKHQSLFSMASKCEQRFGCTSGG